MSVLPANPLRGEAEIRIGAIDFRIAVTFSGLSRLSSAIGARTLDDLYVRLLGFEPKAVACAIRCLTIADDDDKVAELAVRILDDGNISAADQASWNAGIEVALAAHIDAGKRRRDETSTAHMAEMAVAGNVNSPS